MPNNLSKQKKTKRVKIHAEKLAALISEAQNTKTAFYADMADINLAQGAIFKMALFASDQLSENEKEELFILFDYLSDIKDE